MFATVISETSSFRTEVRGRFDRQDEVIDKVEKQTTKTNGRVDKTEERVTAIESKWSSVKYRIGGFVVAMSLLATLVGWALNNGLRIVWK